MHAILHALAKLISKSRNRTCGCTHTHTAHLATPAIELAYTSVIANTLQFTSSRPEGFGLVSTRQKTSTISHVHVVPLHAQTPSLTTQCTAALTASWLTPFLTRRSAGNPSRSCSVSGSKRLHVLAHSSRSPPYFYRIARLYSCTRAHLYARGTRTQSI